MNTSMESGTQMTLQELMQELFREPTVGASDSLARTSALPERSEDSKGTEVHSFSELCSFLRNSRKQIDPNGCSLRMLRTLLAYTGDSILDGYSLKWHGGGTMRNGELSTVRIMVFPKTGSECSLSDILEDSVDEKYFLSETAMKRLMNYKGNKIIS